MSLHFQTYAEFIFVNGKQQLVSTSISSTHSACTSIPFSPFPHKLLTISYIFPTEKNARSYIAHLQKVFPNSPATPPVLDGNQQELFPEVSK